MKLRIPVQGILFDFDGLILDTETPIFQAWEEKFAEFGRQLQLEEWAEILGKSTHALDQVLDLLEELQDPASRKLFLDQVSRRERELVIQQQPLPGAVELIKKANQEGVNLGVVSSSDQDWVHTHLDRLGLLDYFQNTSCVDEVEKAKPDPELYRLGLKKMGLEPDQVVVLEDSPNGMLAAKRAGLYCIAVPNEITRRLEFSGDGEVPDLMLSSLVEFPWEKLMRDHK